MFQIDDVTTDPRGNAENGVSPESPVQVQARAVLPGGVWNAECRTRDLLFERGENAVSAGESSYPGSIRVPMRSGVSSE